MWALIAVGAAIVGVIFWSAVKRTARREAERVTPAALNPEKQRHQREYAAAMRDAAAAERERREREKN